MSDPVVIRFHGMDREGIEERTKNIWNTIIDPRDDELLLLKSVVNDLRERQHQVFVNVSIKSLLQNE
jgi:hypothetical protein